MDPNVGERIARVDGGGCWAEVWLARTRSSEAACLEQLATEDERQHAAKFRDRGRAEAYLRSRGFIRDLLSRYSGKAPSTIAFDHNPHGKPQLLRDSNGLHLNWSRSKDLVLLAVANCEVGIDIEQLRAVPDAKDIVARYFHPLERDTLGPDAARDVSRRFLDLWTRKEAYVKAIGTGLSHGLETFHDVTLDFETPRVHRIVDSASKSEWFATPFDLVDATAALAIPFCPGSSRSAT